MRVGDIPYSETNQGAIGHYRPAYDTQKDVLLGILDELKEADAYLPMEYILREILHRLPEIR